MFIQKFIVFFAVLSSVSSSLPRLTLCENGSSIAPTDRSTAVILRERFSNKEPMEEAFDDAFCWLKKNFIIRESYSVDTHKDNETMCFKIATIPMMVGEIMIVLTEGDSIQDCFINIYGPIPNILNVKMFIDIKLTKDMTFTKRMELSFRNAGGYLGLQFELFHSKAYSKIRKTLAIMMHINRKSFEYENLLSWWEPNDFHVEPPITYQIHWTKEEHAQLMKDNSSISILMMISCLPMLFFGTVVSCYLVIHPRGGLTYTDEELDFVIHEVESVDSVMMSTAKEKSTGYTISLSAIMSADEPTQTDYSNEKVSTKRKTENNTSVEKQASKEKAEQSMEMHTPADADELQLQKTISLTKSMRNPVDDIKVTRSVPNLVQNQNQNQEQLNPDLNNLKPVANPNVVLSAEAVTKNN